MSEQGPAIADRTPIFSLLGANGVSQVGNMMLAVAIPWFVLETTGSAAKVGLTAAAIGVRGASGLRGRGGRAHPDYRRHGCYLPDCDRRYVLQPGAGADGRR